MGVGPNPIRLVSLQEEIQTHKEISEACMQGKHEGEKEALGGSSASQGKAPGETNNAGTLIFQNCEKFVSCMSPSLWLLMMAILAN